MPWFKVDDGIVGNKKFARIPRSQRIAATGLWATLGSWCAHELTNGRVPQHMITEVGGTRKQAALLVGAGLWETVEEGYQFVNWAEYQPTRQQVEADRAAAKDRQQKARERARQRRQEDQSRRDDTVTHGVSHAPVTAASQSPRPDPTRPDTVLTSVGASPKQTHELERAAEEGSAGPVETTLGEFRHWLDDRGDPRLSTAVTDHLGRVIAQLLADDIPVADIQRGLVAWHTKGGTGPGALPGFVHEVRTGANGKSRRQQETDDMFEAAMERARAADAKAAAR